MEEVFLDVIMFCDDGCVNASILTIGLHQRTQDVNIMIAVVVDNVLGITLPDDATLILQKRSDTN